MTESLVLLCIIILSTTLGVLLGGGFLLAALGLLARLVAPAAASPRPER